MEAGIDGGRLLLVDDERSFLEPTADMLRRLGHDCRVAPDADRAREILAHERFEVVVSDLRMPGNRELDFVRTVCDAEDGPAVIVVTGYPSVDTAVGAIDLNVFAYLVKPVDIGVLRERVDEALRQVRLRRGMAALEDRLERVGEDLRAVHALFRRPQRDVDAAALVSRLDGTADALRAGLRELDRLAGGGDPGASASPSVPTSSDAPTLPHTPGADEDLSVLSPREQDVLALIRSGYRVSTVARRLAISPHTVRNHLKRIFLKLEVGSQTELLEKLNPLRDA